MCMLVCFLYLFLLLSFFPLSVFNLSVYFFISSFFLYLLCNNPLVCVSNATRDIKSTVIKSIKFKICMINLQCVAEITARHVCRVNYSSICYNYNIYTTNSTICPYFTLKDIFLSKLQLSLFYVKVPSRTFLVVKI